MLGFFFRHSDAWVERYVIYDDGSDRATLDRLVRHPAVEVRSMPPRQPGSYLAAARALRDGMWKESRGQADWVIVTDIDEHIYHPDLPAYLARCKAEGVTAIPGLGYQMVSRQPPEPDAVLARDYTRGVPSRLMNKLSLFDPDRIDDTHFTAGRHAAKLTGRVQYPVCDELVNLHYKYLDANRALARNQELLARLTPAEQRLGPGRDYRRTAADVRLWMDRWDRAAVDVSTVATRGGGADRDPSVPSWWYCPPWWRLRWWHPHSWWSALSPGARGLIGSAARAAGLLS